MDSINLDYFIHAANILLLGAYSVRDILWLRLLAVASSLAALPYFLLQPTPLWAAFGWSVLFTAINVFQTWRLLLERRPVKLTPEEEEVRRLAFPDLPPRKVLQVLSIGSWATASPGERLIQHGKPVDSMSLIVRGNVQVSKDGRVLGDLGAGEMVGSALLLSGAVAEVDAVTTGPARTIRWEAATLERYLDANPETRNLFQRHLSRDLAGKVQRLGTLRTTLIGLVAAGLVCSQVLGCASPAAVSDYRSRMQSVDVSKAFEATGTPDVSHLPTGHEWITHVESDLLPYWTTPVALGDPIGNFPTFRANDGSVMNPKDLPQEVRAIAASETWLLNRMGRQYTRTMSRQIYAYCVAYHLTGDERYLRYARVGLDYLFTKMVDRDGVFYSWIENGVPAPENAKQRISQDMAYALMGPAMYYYLTRDQGVLAVIRKTTKYIFDNYRDGNGLRWINEAFTDLEETHLPSQKELVAQLDQINGYMLIMTTVLEGKERDAWLNDMIMLANTMKADYYNPELNQFWGRIDSVEYKRLGQPHVDFGHTIKTLWMMLEIGTRFGATDLRDFALQNMPRVFSEAYSKDYDTWIEKKLEGGALGTDRIWWLHDELDQAAATLSLTDVSYVRYLIPAYRYWFFEFVDQKGKDVWHGLTGEPGKPGKPMLLKAHLWKNAFHDFEHALVGYITCQSVRGEPAKLYYAFENQPADNTIQPYLFAAKINGIERTDQQMLGKYRKVVVTFSDVRP